MKDAKLSLFADDLYICLHRIPQSTREFSKSRKYEIQVQKSISCLYTRNKQKMQ